MFDIIVKDVETAHSLGTVKDAFTIPREGEILQMDSKRWKIVTSFYEPSLRGLSANTYIVWVASIDKDNNNERTKNHIEQTQEEAICKPGNLPVRITVFAIIVLLWLFWVLCLCGFNVK